jgi:phytoene dehydrogenase-like protein
MEIESIVIGAGVIGLAIARRLPLSGRDVLLLERNSSFGQEISAEFNEVLRRICAKQHWLPGSDQRKLLILNALLPTNAPY